MKPVEKVMKKLGMGRRALANELKIDPSTIARWEYDKEKHGLGGNIPYKYHDRLREIAINNNTTLTAEDFIK